MATEEANGEWVPNGENPDPPYDPAPVDEEIVDEQYSDAEVLEGLENVPPREDIIAGLEAFREPFAETRRREIATELWPEYESEIWTGVWEAPSTDDVDPDTGELVNGVRWSEAAGCPVHVQATADQERSIGEQAVNDANAAVDAIVQRYEEILDDTNYENSLTTGQRIQAAKGSFDEFLAAQANSINVIRELFETDWTGDLASDKGKQFFGSDVITEAIDNQWNLSNNLMMYAAEEVRAQVTVHASLGQMVYDCYGDMAKKTHLTLDVKVLQSIADAIGTIGLLSKVPGGANVTGWLAGMITKQGDFVISLSRESFASSNDIAKWASDLNGAVDTAESKLAEVREEIGGDLARLLGLVDIGSTKYIPGEGYQDA